MAEPSKTPGQEAYERDVRRRPLYRDGTPRKAWAELCEAARWSWERNPTDREPARRRAGAKPVARPEVPEPPGFHCPRAALDAEGGPRRRVYCGPWVVMALTGRPYVEVRAAVNAVRERDPSRPVAGMFNHELRLVLGALGVRTGETSHPTSAGLGVRPTFAAWLRARSKEERGKTFIVAAAHHFMLVRGNKATCSIVGHWTRIGAAAKRRGYVSAVIPVPEAG